MASFIDGVAPEATFIARLNVVNYDGGFEADRSVPIAGRAVLDVDIESRAFGLTLFWRPSWGGIGDRWSYAMSATVPLVDITVAGTATAASSQAGLAARREDSERGLGDILLLPLMFNCSATPNLNYNFRLGVYAPTGDYETGRLANTGKNFWTLEPTAAVVYFGQKNGVEATLFLGVDTNTENPDTDYRSGTQAHLDGTVAQHLPIWGGAAGLGLTGFWYQQLVDDSGDGATLGGFRASAHGLGPVLSYVRPFGDAQLAFELKWLRGFQNKNRPEGDTLFLKLMWKSY